MGMGEFFEKLGSGALATLATVAPMAASAFGGPLAGVAAQKIIGALGLAPDTSKAQLEEAIIGATPEQLLALKKAEQDFLLDCRRLEIDVTKIQAADRADARSREVKTGDSTTPRLLAGLVMGLYIAVQYFLLTEVIEPTMREIVMRSLGTLDAAVGLVLGYYFGSSIGSAKKDDRIATLQGKE
jgi:hypothetical protein